MKGKLTSLLLLSLAFLAACSKPEVTPEEQPGENTEVTDEKKTSEISVMSFNVRYLAGDVGGSHAWDKREPGIYAMLSEQKPVVMCVQEAYVSQVDDILEAMPEYKAYAISRDGASTNNETNGIFYLKDSLVMMNLGNFWLSESPSKVSFGWDAACTRICTWMHFKVKSSGKQFMVFNTHLDHVGTTAQYEGIRLVWSKMKELNKAGLPVFLTGDMNVKPDNRIFTDNPYASAREDAPVTDNHVTYNAFGGSSGKIIDYIFYEGMTPLTFKTITDEYAGIRYISDHYPIMATFEYQY